MSPPPGPDLARLSATEAIGLMRAGELSPVDLVEDVLAAADLAAGRVNPFTARYDEEALRQAREAEQRYADGSARPLEGIPVAVKELTPVAGQQHTLASLALADNVAAETAPIASRLLEAGAIVHARTTTPEFGCASVTRSRLYGETRNPWNPDLSTAGSSGGSAAALASAAAILATGTDSAGSLRMPAAACGVLGLKPSCGTVPVAGPLGLETTHHDGPMARTVGDLALMLGVIAGPAPQAPWHARPAPDLSDIEAGVDGWPVALASGIAGLDFDPDVAANTAGAAAALADGGARVEEVEIDWSYEEIIEATKLHYAIAYGPMVERVTAAAPELATPYALAFAAEMRSFGERPGFAIEARERTCALWAKLDAVLREHRLLLLPTMAMPAPELGDDYVDHGPTVAGREQPDRWIVGTTVAFNLCSWCPALSVPSGRAANGVPTGVQLVGRPWADADVLRAARALEGAAPWPTTIS
ncbi:MAG TPA: amidase family protein [Solirubrobacterales bacterium]